jgi:hypothetical protein
MPNLTSAGRRYSAPVAPLCGFCGEPMELFFRDKHPEIAKHELVAFQCTTCSGPILTEIVEFVPKSKR